MKDLTFSFQYRQYNTDELSEPDKLLVEQAIEATRHSYAPYSKYCVGAALRLDGGEIIQGANQENASYPCGTCAERTALNYAQSSRPTLRVKTIAIAAQNEDEHEFSCTHLPFIDPKISKTTPYPCGLCRQALAEVEHRQEAAIRILLVSRDSVMEIPSAACLLPFSFRLS